MIAVSTDLLIYLLFAGWVLLVVAGFYLCYYVGYSSALEDTSRQFGQTRRHIVIEDDDYDDDDWELGIQLDSEDYMEDLKQEVWENMEDNYER
jgi:hypothetical protein